MMNWIGVYTMIRRETERTMRVVIQTLVSPVMSAALYIFIFGHVIGTKIDSIVGVPYITFVFPGILTLSVINSAFGASSSTVYMNRFMRSVEEILIAPFSYLEMIFGFMLGAMVRALMVSVLIMCVGVLFGAVTLNNPIAFILYVTAIGGIFSLLGILVGLWAEGFDQFTALNTFVITPFTYLGGIFYSVTMLPPLAAHITFMNPFFYFVDGIRGSMIGVHEGSIFVGLAIILGLLTVLTTLVVYLFRKGWKIRT